MGLGQALAAVSSVLDDLGQYPCECSRSVVPWEVTERYFRSLR